MREKQEVVEQFLSGRYVFFSLPMGSGKSLCYSILPSLFDKLKRNTGVDARSVVIVVSPLIALMKDQVRALTERNVRAVYIGEKSDE